MARQTLRLPTADIMPGSCAVTLKFLAAVISWLHVAGESSVWGPRSQADQPAWLKKLKADRKRTLKTLNWQGGAFAMVPWTQTAYIQPQMHPFDRYFYDPEKDMYTVQRYLQDVKDRYGGIDAMLMWPTYTNIGIDDRNQFDYIRSMPGGLDGVRNFTAELKAAGVRVLWPYNPWDIGTRREPISDQATLAEMVKKTGGDGFNGDTMSDVPKSFWDAALHKSYPMAFEPEHAERSPDVALNWTTMGWGYWNYPSKPVVDRFKFITRGKYMTNVCDRWAKDKTDNLQSAWFNGDGYESWENVWGIWNGITPYDGEAIRRVGTMLRYFGKAGFLQSPHWEPYTREVWQEGIYASKFPLPHRKQTVWSIVNRNNVKLTVGLVVGGGKKYYDCYHGEELKAAPDIPHSGPQVSFPMEARGYGCLLETEIAAEDSLVEFLATMKKLTQKPLSSYDHHWKYLPQRLVEIPKTSLAKAAPAGMVYVPWTDNFKFVVKGLEIEGTDGDGVDVQYPWEEHPRREHSKILTVGPFYMDKYPVTNAQYSAYLQATGYWPKDTYNWLKSWNGSTVPRAELAEKPVTYIGLDEARKYCAWVGGRLPHSWEWQYAAQGYDGRKYPWGSENDQRKYPSMTSGNTFNGPESVTAHAPIGDSVFGVSDLVGNVWQYTDEFQDDHTRAVILRGGSNYRPEGSNWYFPQALELDEHQKYFLFNERYERAGTIGFRCVVDAVLSQACSDHGWKDFWGYDCSSYATSGACGTPSWFGKSAKEACCECGGGILLDANGIPSQRSATPALRRPDATPKPAQGQPDASSTPPRRNPDSTTVLTFVSAPTILVACAGAIGGSVMVGMLIASRLRRDASAYLPLQG